MKMDLITNHYRVCDLVLFFLSFKSSGDFWRESYNWWCIPASTIWIELVGIPLHCHSSDLSNFPFVLLPILESFRCLSTLSLSLSLSLSISQLKPFSLAHDMGKCGLSLYSSPLRRKMTTRVRECQAIIQLLSWSNDGSNLVRAYKCESINQFFIYISYRMTFFLVTKFAMF